MMLGLKFGVLALQLLTAVQAVKYGYNWVPVVRDPPAVAAQFQDVDVKLLSPAFLNPGSRQPGFANGTQGPTSQADISEYLNRIMLPTRPG